MDKVETHTRVVDQWVYTCELSSTLNNDKKTNMWEEIVKCICVNKVPH